MYRIGIVDTTFSRVDMAKIVIDELRNNLSSIQVIRYTVPGIKDIPVAAKRLIEEHNCDIVITLGWVGKTQTDKYSYLASSMGIILVQLLTNRHVIDVTIHEDEAEDPKELLQIAVDRARKHARNLIALLRGKETLSRWAGTGRRQGRPDVGPIKI